MKIFDKEEDMGKNGVASSAELGSLEEGYQFGMEHAALLIESLGYEARTAGEQEALLRVAGKIRARAKKMPGAKNFGGLVLRGAP